MQRRAPASARGTPRGFSRAALLVALTTCCALTSGATPSDAGTQPSFPALTGRVVDAADLMAPATRATLIRELAAHESTTGQQVVVATLPTLGGHAIEDYGYQLGRHWGIGRAGRDDGAILLIAQAERQIRIEVGYGLEGQLTDAASWDIIQSHIAPWFRQGDYDAGILAGTRAILATLTGSTPIPDAAAPANEPSRDLPAALLFWIFVIFILLNALGGRRRRRLARSGLPGIILAGSRGLPGGLGGGGFGGRGGGFGGGGASGGW